MPVQGVPAPGARARACAHVLMDALCLVEVPAWYIVCRVPHLSGRLRPLCGARLHGVHGQLRVPQTHELGTEVVRMDLSLRAPCQPTLVNTQH